MSYKKILDNFFNKKRKLQLSLLEGILSKEWSGDKTWHLDQDESNQVLDNRGAQTIKFIEYCRERNYPLFAPSNVKADVISLEGSPRRKVFEQNAEKAGLSFSFYNAINGFDEQLDPTKLNSWGLSSFPKQWEDNKGHMACTLSHMELYSQYIQNSDSNEWRLVLEDDCYFHPYFSAGLNKVMEIVNSSDSDIDVIYLSNRASHWLSLDTQKKYISGTMELVPLDELSDEIKNSRGRGYASQYSPKQTKVFGTESILFTPKGIRKLKYFADLHGGNILGDHFSPGPFGIEAILQHHLGRSSSYSGFKTPPALIEDGTVDENTAYLNSFILTLPLTTTRDWLGDTYFSETRRKMINKNRN